MPLRGSIFRFCENDLGRVVAAKKLSTLSKNCHSEEGGTPSEGPYVVCFNGAADEVTTASSAECSNAATQIHNRNDPHPVAFISRSITFRKAWLMRV